MIADTGKVFYTTTADEHYAVLLQVVSFTGNICCNFKSVHKTDTCDFTQC